jgi:hypothetical protein
MAKATRSNAEGGVKAVQAASAPRGPGAQKAQSKSNLTGGWTRQELTQSNKIRVSGLVDPLSTNDKLVAEISKMRDRPSERGKPEL